MKAKSTFSLKDQLFNAEKVEWLAGQFAAADQNFREAEFCDAVLSEFPNLELKERIVHITSCLESQLPDDYLAALAVIVKALPPKLDTQKTDDDFGDFILAPLSHFVATRGCSAEFLTKSLSALREMTMRFTVEDAIRFFINAFPSETMRFLRECAADENYHVRRLASEGTRAKLPWCQRIGIDYREPVPILDLLFADSTRYVTRSVANHLNDISKLNAPLVVETLQRWKKTKRQDEKEMAFIIRHATRTLVKNGDQGALSLLGFGEKPEIELADFSIQTPVVKIGEALEFSLTFEPNRTQNLLIDYRMQFAGDGKPGGQKVFKLKQLETTKGKSVTLKKRHPMKLMTTRTLYGGEHAITLLVNGVEFETKCFELVS